MHHFEIFVLEKQDLEISFFGSCLVLFLGLARRGFFSLNLSPDSIQADSSAHKICKAIGFPLISLIWFTWNVEFVMVSLSNRRPYTNPPWLN